MGQHILMTPRKPRQSVEHVTGKQPEAKKRGIEDTAGIPTGVALTSTVARLAQRIPLMTVKNGSAVHGSKRRRFTWKCRAMRSENWQNVCGKSRKIFGNQLGKTAF